MKTTLIILLCLTFCVCSQAQDFEFSYEQRYLKDHYQKILNFNETKEFERTYLNPKLLRTKIKENSNLDSMFVLNEVIVYFTTDSNRKYKYYFDSEGILKSHDVYIMNNGHWDYNGNVSYSYDEKGYLIIITYGQSSREVFTYDDKGNLLTEIYQMYRDYFGWENLFGTFYTYDSLFNKISSIMDETWTNDQWALDYQYSFTYDNKGKTLSYQIDHYSSDTGELLDAYRTFHKRDSNGNIVTSKGELWKDTAWVNNFMDEYLRDSTNKYFWTKTREIWTNEQWVKSYRLNDTFDLNQMLISESKEIWVNEKWINSYHDVLSRNLNGDILNRSYYIWLNDHWDNTMQETYKYNNNGLLIYGLSEKTDSTSKWIGNEISFTFEDSKSSYDFHGYKIEINYQTKLTSVSDNKNPLNSLLIIPNPSSSGLTKIYYSLKEPLNVTLTLNNEVGIVSRVILNNIPQEAGEHCLDFETQEISNSVYFLVLNCGKYCETKKLVICR